jgi:hypothetical protein
MILQGEAEEDEDCCDGEDSSGSLSVNDQLFNSTFVKSVQNVQTSSPVSFSVLDRMQITSAKRRETLDFMSSEKKIPFSPLTIHASNSKSIFKSSENLLSMKIEDLVQRFIMKDADSEGLH